MLLLTGNRSMKGPHSLEQTNREENTLTSLPVITVSSAHGLDERLYRERCGSRLIEIILDLDNYLGVVVSSFPNCADARFPSTLESRAKLAYATQPRRNLSSKTTPDADRGHAEG